MPDFVPVFGFTNGGKDGAHCCFISSTEKQTNLWNHYFSAGIWFLRQSLENQSLLLKQKHWLGTLLLQRSKNVFKQKGDVSEATIFLQILGGEYSRFVTPFLSSLGFFFLTFFCLVLSVSLVRSFRLAGLVFPSRWFGASAMPSPNRQIFHPLWNKTREQVHFEKAVHLNNPCHTKSN